MTPHCLICDALNSLLSIVGHEGRSTDAKGQVDGRAEGGQAKVIPDAAVQLPTLLGLRHPEQQQPGHDEKHADPDDELHQEQGDCQEVVLSLYVDR